MTYERMKMEVISLYIRLGQQQSHKGLEMGTMLGRLQSQQTHRSCPFQKSYHVEFMRQDVDRFADNWIKGQEAIRNIAIKRDKVEIESLLKKCW